MGRRHRRGQRREGVFDPEDKTRVRQKRYGVWMLYEEIPQYGNWEIPGVNALVRVAEAFTNIAYLGRLALQLVSISPVLCVLYLASCWLNAVLPAVGVWLSGQMLNIVQSAIDTRTLDEGWLFWIVMARIAAGVATRLNSVFGSRCSLPLQKRLRFQFTRHILRSHLRIDVPTYNDAAISRQLESNYGRGNAEQAWAIISTVIRVLMSVVKLTSSLAVLLALLWSHQESIPLALVSFLAPMLEWFSLQRGHNTGAGAPPLRAHNVPEFEKAATLVGEDNLMEYHQARNEEYARERLFDLNKWIKNLVEQLPQIVFTLQVVRSPASMPFTMASFSVIQQSVQTFTMQVVQLMYSGDNVAQSLQSLKELYELINVKNRVVDGTEPFPENAQETATHGISIEFKNVSFQYPGADVYALKDVSFKVDRGMLCVLVGFNGSGKSTILKLITRLHDPTEGEILCDGRDIKTLRLADLRNTISVLFQDFEIFPLSIRDNIRLGNVDHTEDDELIEAAAQRGGVTDFVDRLPEGLDSYLKHPVRDVYSSLPEGTKQLFGKPVDFSRLRGYASNTQDLALSGGQAQRVAVARTLMRAMGGHDRIGLLLFDEPSASLDPEAEYNLFNTLRTLRGTKSMIFSSHRFGNLTRHADLILYMKDSTIVESGTHDQLLAMDGGYARMWKMQAQAFLP
ncbi:P-loop containing nucleoside triphosphate hydrolase protein [Auricularia subglabra TFB-10046 SS5]|nr:P-loop containing nucleoside triphosphate hydrolase protein [Auricularia subglabra TFB-10046 SS5]